MALSAVDASDAATSAASQSRESASLDTSDESEALGVPTTSRAVKPGGRRPLRVGTVAGTS
jgi:hypothetical protein